MTPAFCLPGARAINRRYTYSGDFLRVRIDEFDDSGKQVTREVVERPAAVAMIAVTTDQQLILIRQNRHAVDEKTQELPAGLIDPGETAEEAAVRELFEETGYRPAGMQEITALYASPGYSDERITLFLATGCERHTDQPMDAATIDVELVSSSELDKLIDQAGETPVDAKTFAGLLWLRVHRSRIDPE